MSDLSRVVLQLQDALEGIEPLLDEQDLSGTALEDFKVTVDGARTIVLAILSATDSADHHGFVREYRLRRAAQVCQGVLYSLVDGSVSADTPGFGELRSTVAKALDRFDRFLSPR